MGELVRGRALTDTTAKTATGNGAAVEVSAVATGQRLVATLHVLTASVGDTLDVVIQSDALEAFGSATNRITFDQVTAVGSQQKSIDGPITDTWFRESRTIGGSGPSFTYILTVGVGAAAAEAPVIEDANLALVAALGGNGNVAAIYVATNGVTGEKADSIIETGGVIDEWQDYRGPSGYAPTIFAGTAKPAWNSTDKTVVGDGVDDEGSSAAVAIFDLAGAKALVMVGSYVSGSYTAALSTGVDVSRFLAFEVTTNWRAQIDALYPGPDSGVVANSTRRVIIASKNAGTVGKVVVPNQSQVTNTPSASAAGNNVITIFKAFPGGGSPAAAGAVFKALLVLNFDPDVTQLDIIRDWAITNLGAVAA